VGAPQGKDEDSHYTILGCVHQEIQVSFQFSKRFVWTFRTRSSSYLGDFVCFGVR